MEFSAKAQDPQMFMKIARSYANHGDEGRLKAFLYNCRFYLFDDEYVEAITRARPLLEKLESEFREKGRPLLLPFDRVMFLFKARIDVKDAAFGFGYDAYTGSALVAVADKLGVDLVAYRPDKPGEKDMVDWTRDKLATIALFLESQAVETVSADIRGAFKKDVAKGRDMADVLGVVKVKVSRNPPPCLRLVKDTEKENIDWQHRWEVAGHWRTIKGLGHAPDGSRIEGKTWIRPFVKGPEDKPLVIKERRVNAAN